MAISDLPREIFSGYYKTGHCQGIAVDEEKGFIYYSFTTCLVKSDLQGHILGSVKGLLGHLGCIDFCEEDGRVYGSLEYKNDEIGQGILRNMGSSQSLTTGFYCAMFDVDRISRMDMDAQADGVMTAAYLRDVVDDYLAVENGLSHRYGCSGIDGTAIGPLPGSNPASKRYVLIAYGIYGDTTRSDNDDQVILCYDPDDLRRGAKPLVQNAMHTSGPEKPFRKLFVRTGNTVYGIQNLEYDESTGDYLAAVYCGKKPIYANKPMYVFTGDSMPMQVRDALDFPYGQTGMCSLRNGLYYFSEDGKDEQGWYTTVRLYRRDGSTFVPA